MHRIEIPAERAARHGGPDFYKGGAKFAETFEMWGGLLSHHSVLDIGCGPGRMAIGIGERFNWTNSLIGFDVIKVDIDICQNFISTLHPDFRFFHLNVWNGLYNPNGSVLPHEVVFPVISESIDFAFATSVFTHLYKRETAHYLTEAYRVLRPGGKLLASWFAITDATKKSPNARFGFQHQLPDGTFTDFLDKPEEAIGFELEDVLSLLSTAGFREVEFYQGAWSKTLPRSGVRHGQDVFIATK
jgi:SAM-dependent methyltransferase